METIRFSGGVIHAIDQTALPSRVRMLSLRSTPQLVQAIAKLRIRGAPMLGIAGAMGVAQAAYRAAAAPRATAASAASAAAKAGEALKKTRPTAVNLAWAIDRAVALAKETASANGAAPADVALALEAEAAAIAAEDEAACLAMASAGQRFVKKGATVVTHCNTGSLCTGGYGTALGVIRLAHEQGKNIDVLAGETRPLLQGARLTAWELGRLGVPHALVPDGATPALIGRGEADVVIVGADRIAANGDVANKIGTYALALAAREAKIPFVVVAPVSTIDPATPSGAAIHIEERDPREVTSVLGSPVAPRGTRARNPAFDVTPAKLVTAIVTERGVATAPYRASIAKIIGRSSRSSRRPLHRR